MENCVVVGGGSAGILAALLAKESCDQVYLIESGDELGGLLRSQTIEGFDYDIGTHFLPETNNPKIDQLLYGTESHIQELFISLDHMHAANYFNGQWNHNSHLIDCRVLPTAIYQQGLVDLLHLQPETEPESDFSAYLDTTYGATFAKHIYHPLLQKIFAIPVAEMDKAVLDIFSLQRLILGSPHIAEQLKQLAFFDQRLGFHDCSQGKPDSRYFYPKQGGIGQWCRSLEQKLVEQKIHILKQTSIEAIESKDGKVVCLKLHKHDSIDCSHLLWTAPPVFLLKSIGENGDNMPQLEGRVRLRNSIICHIESHTPFPLKAHYAYCFDEGFSSFRFTFYENFRSGNSGKYHLTLEILCADIPDKSDIETTVRNEMLQLKLIDHLDAISKLHIEVIRNTFPVYDQNFLNNSALLCQTIEENFSNVCVLGRFSGKGFTMGRVFLNTLDKLEEYFNGAG